jgi:hypothetical protein
MRPAINLGLLCLAGLGAADRLRADTVSLGSASCSASGCHGGAGEKSDQFVIWSQRDVHARSFATLTTARAARMSEALSIGNPATSPRCVVCHAPLAGVEPARLGAGVDPAEGVSCSTCHNPPGAWIRSHTRSDWTHADRVAAGMRDLDDLYMRANACVACHQNLDPALVNVGRHPALIFELDGQTQDEPRHWSEHAGAVGAQAWFVGQAVAFREVSWALLNGHADPARSVPAWRGLGWLLGRTGLDYRLPAIDCSAQGPDALASALQTSDLLAKRAAQAWDPKAASTLLRRLSATRNDFLAPGMDRLEGACRAERLVLALDRLLAALPEAERPAGASARLDRLFHLAQSQPDFVPEDFARELDGFSRSLDRAG